MKVIPEVTLKAVKASLATGQPSRAIAKDLGVSKSLVNKMRSSMPRDTPKPNASAANKLTAQDNEYAVSLMKRGHAKTAVEATRIVNQGLSKPVCAETVRRALKEVGNLVARKKKKKPALTLAHRRKRLRWAIEHRYWTVDDWKSVIWSDETKINRLCSDGLQYGWVERGSGLSDRIIQPTVKFGGDSIMVWGSMAWPGVGALVKIVGTMDSQQYVDILENALLPTIERVSSEPELPPRNHLIFQQDNDPKHTSKLAMRWFQDAGIKVLKWPAPSPDLNPIEHLWVHLKNLLGSQSEAPRGVLELWERVREAWKTITAETCQTLIESMPRRVEAVIKSRGGPTKY